MALMRYNLEFVSGGTITSAKGFKAGAVFSGINKHSRYKLDVGVLYSETDCIAAGVFTRNRIKSAPVCLCMERLPSSSVRAVIANSGCANACTGDQGQYNASKMSSITADKFGVPLTSVLIASTGVIGRQLPMDLLENAVNQITLSINGGHDMAKAIMTTDTVQKEAAVNTGKYVIGGIAKGSGMIHPDMATMLCFLSTDARVDQTFLQKALSTSVNKSFNMISVDGDTSPNDTVLLLSNGSSNTYIYDGTEESVIFQQALDIVCIQLAKAVARDGEGATKLIEVNVTGAKTSGDARLIARTITTSPLVKTAIHGCDPNWGRIVVAAGRSGAEVIESCLNLRLCGVPVLKSGIPVDFNNDNLVRLMHSEDITIDINLNIGGGEAVGWGCDLSAEYVSINSDYTT